MFNSYALDADLEEIPLTFGSSTYTYTSPWTPPPPATIRIDPEFTMNRSLIPCTNFTIDIKIYEATNVSSFEFELEFNRTILNASEADIGDFFPPSAVPTIEINNTIGFVSFSVALDPSDTPRSGSGILATITFHVEGNGLSWLNLTNIQLRDSKHRLLPCTAFIGYFSNVAILGDLNGDGKIDIMDVAIASTAFGSYPGHSRWDERADIDGNGIVNTKDVALICRNFGQFQ